MCEKWKAWVCGCDADADYVCPECRRQKKAERKALKEAENHEEQPR